MSLLPLLTAAWMSLRKHYHQDSPPQHRNDSGMLHSWSTHTHHPHPLLSYSTKERIFSPASFVHCLHNYGERSWKACTFFFSFLSLLISMSFQNPVNSLSFLNLTLLPPLYRREWLSWVEIITQKDFNLMASVLIKGRNRRHHTHTCVHMRTYTKQGRRH